MHTAVTTHEGPTSSPHAVLLGWLSLASQLTESGVALRYASLPVGFVGEFDPDTQSFLIRADAAIEDQVWVLGQLVGYLAHGLEGSPAARLSSPLLRIVPAPREAPGVRAEQSA